MKTQFYTPWDSDYLMESNGFFCGFNMPEALNSNEDFMHELPEYARRSSFLVDEYPSCPKEWMRSKGKLTSYFVPVQEGKGVWLDFNDNARKKHDVAIVVSVQGVNAITGLPCKDDHLEQYIEKCPKHKKTFGPNRFCEECGFKWPKQNYIATTETPQGKLWLDGFRAANGAVQQYLLTQERIKGVASNIIGEERVFAIGISFFLSKRPRTLPSSTLYSTKFKPFSWEMPRNTYKNLSGDNKDTNIFVSENSSNVNFSDKNNATYCTNSSLPKNNYKHHAPSSKRIEIGAGASIRQQIHNDSEPLDYWRNESEATICINYCMESVARQITNKGKVDKQGHPKGFLKDIPTNK